MSQPVRTAGEARPARSAGEASPTRSAGEARGHAIRCVLGSSFAYSVSAALAKSVSGDIPTIEIVFFRNAIAALVLLPLLWRHGGLKALRTRQPWGHVMRLAAGYTGMLGSFYGYAHLPLATNTALSFAMPLILTLLSAKLLGETVGWRRRSAVLAGLVGVLVIVRPWADFGGGTAVLPPLPVAIVLTGVLGSALAMVSIRRMGAGGENNVAIVMWFALGCTALSALLLPGVWRAPSLLQLAALCAIGAVSAGAQLLMTEAYRTGEAAVVGPFEYSAIVYTSLMGAVIWGEFPDAWSLAGMAIVIGAGLYIWWREVTLARRRQ